MKVTGSMGSETFPLVSTNKVARGEYDCSDADSEYVFCTPTGTQSEQAMGIICS